MASFLNRPDKVNVDSFSDPTLDTAGNNGYFSQFTNQLKEPILNVKGIQLLRANFVNPSLPLNDFNGQLIFVYSRNTTTAIPSDGSTFKVVRLLPSWYVPAASFTTYTKNKYFNNGTELVAALNAAASTSGDSATYNPSWVANDVSFSFDTTTRRISFTGNTATNYYAPVPADHPAMATFLSGVNRPKMNAAGYSGSYALALNQPLNSNSLMNSRLGFALQYNNRGVFWTGSSILGCATSTGTPTVNGTSVEADSFPILVGSQNINVFCSVINGSSTDTNANRNLIATLPIENGALGVNSYTLTSVEKPAKSVASEIYTLQFNFTDDYGNPFYFYNNMNVNLELNIYY
jgi:hypothetical protein